MAGLLGTDGNININRLEKDLRKALDFDIKYKQTDNMKKRACKVATDYDEFKNMVACAHLKTLRYHQSFQHSHLLSPHLLTHNNPYSL